MPDSYLPGWWKPSAHATYHFPRKPGGLSLCGKWRHFEAKKGHEVPTYLPNENDRCCNECADQLWESSVRTLLAEMGQERRPVNLHGRDTITIRPEVWRDWTTRIAALLGPAATREGTPDAHTE